MRKVLSILLFISICLFSCNNYKKHTQQEVVFLTYGELPPLNYIDEKDSTITKKFGFKIKRIAGCIITDSIVNKVMMANTKSYYQMKLKYGNEWINKFEKETGIIFSVPFIE